MACHLPLCIVIDGGIVYGMAPKREGTAINVRLPDDMIAKIDHRRASTGQSRAEAIRKMLAWALTQKADHDTTT
jgi:metal-responsive CopG/Arc/MetJ family transcriptional regulator